MRIRTSLMAQSIVSIVMLAGLLASTALAFRNLRRAEAYEFFLIDLERNQVERIMLRDDYLLAGHHGSLEKFKGKSSQVHGLLKELSGMRLTPEARELADLTIRKFEASMALLPRLSALRNSLETAPQPDRELRSLEGRLIKQLIVNAYLSSDSLSLLLEDARKVTIRSRNLLLTVFALFTVLLAAVVLLTTLYLNRLVSRGISALKTGTDLVAEGRLDHRIGLQGNHELAELGRQFDAMTGRLQRSYAALESANRELEGFSYTVSHDLRTPLRHILSFSELLQRQNASGLDEKSRHFLDVICQGATTMGRLIEDLLSYSRAGRVEMQKCRVRLDDLVAAVRADLSPAAAGRQVRWEVSPLPDVPGDETMLRLVLSNLLANALKFTRHRAEAVITVGGRREGDDAVIFVRDNGAGFDMKYADKLFGLFRRLHRTDEFEGTGVGLANVQRVVLRHGGRVWADSRVDEGATFSFSIPLNPEAPPWAT